MSLKYLDDILELLASEKFRTLVKDVEFNLQGTLKVDVIATIFCMTILFYMWKKLFGVFHREQPDAEVNHLNEQNYYPPEQEQEEPSINDNESTRATEGESSDNESGNLHEDSDAIPNDQESWSGLILDHPHQHSDMSFPVSESSDYQSRNYQGNSEATQDDQESLSGLILDHPHQQSDMNFPESESSNNQSRSYMADSEARQDEPESWSGPIVKCNCDSHSH